MVKLELKGLSGGKNTGSNSGREENDDEKTQRFTYEASKDFEIEGKPGVFVIMDDPHLLEKI